MEIPTYVISAITGFKKVLEKILLLYEPRGQSENQKQGYCRMNLHADVTRHSLQLIHSQIDHNVCEQHCIALAIRIGQILKYCIVYNIIFVTLQCGPYHGFENYTENTNILISTITLLYNLKQGNSNSLLIQAYCVVMLTITL